MVLHGESDLQIIVSHDTAQGEARLQSKRVVEFFAGFWHLATAKEILSALAAFPLLLPAAASGCL